MGYDLDYLASEVEKAKERLTSAIPSVFKIGSKVSYAGPRGPLEGVVTGYKEESLFLNEKVVRHFSKVKAV